MHQVLLSIEGFKFKVTIKYQVENIYFHHEKFTRNLLPNMANTFCIFKKFQTVLKTRVYFSLYAQLRHFFTSFLCLKWLHLFFRIRNAQLTPNVFPFNNNKTLDWKRTEKKRPINQEAEETPHSTGQIHPRGKKKEITFSILKSKVPRSEKGLLRPGREEGLCNLTRKFLQTETQHFAPSVKCPFIVTTPNISFDDTKSYKGLPLLTCSVKEHCMCTTKINVTNFSDLNTIPKKKPG